MFASPFSQGPQAVYNVLFLNIQNIFYVHVEVQPSQSASQLLEEHRFFLRSVHTCVRGSRTPFHKNAGFFR